MENTARETCYYPVELNISKAGKTIHTEQALPLDFSKVEGVLILNPGGACGKGKLALSIGGEEIFPPNFHAKAFMYHQSSNSEDDIITKQLDSYMYAIQEKAQGATVKATYKEPVGGAKGTLYLLFKLTKE